MLPAALLVSVCCLMAVEPVVVDRIAVVVSGRAIKTSDVEREVRLTEFLNGEALDLSAGARRKAAERLIDQMLIRRELEAGGYGEADEAETRAFLKQVRAQRFPAGEAAWRAALQRYGLKAEQVERHLRWQLTVLKFIDQRFRVGAADAQAVNQLFETWLEEQRRRVRPQYKPGALE
jgi:hypothetical protein